MANLGIDILEAGPMGGGKTARDAGRGDEKDEAQDGLSRHIDEYGQSRFHLKSSGHNTQALELLQ
ncbi:hypothetical protein AnigIFM56816_000822 [Aspergillus niger]|nr:hypothetical protein AnigIFM56816_000822 [Aspergillus niger]